jgi:hypothetical protein
LIWVVSSLVMCVWLIWFGLALARTGAAYAAREPGVTFKA